MRYAFVADHFQYLASLGVLTLVAAGIVRVAAAPAVPVAAALFVLAALTAWQTLAYRSLDTLWGDTIAKNPRSVLALQNLGTIRFLRNDPAGALALWEQAREVEPEQPDVWNGIGLAQARLGRGQDAVASFERALRADPRHAEAARNLGTALGAAGRRDDAIAAYERAIAAAPGMAEAREDVAVLLAAAGRLDEAETQLREAIRRAPSPRAFMQLGATFVARARWAEAAAAYENALRLAPRSIEASAGLAEAYAGLGDFPRAATAVERARSLADGEGRTSTAAELARRLAAYRAGTGSPR
jgi:tetratricopeptide (TPR) repeat protein